MRLIAVDWVVIVVFICLISLVGVLASRKVRGQKEQLLVAGRNLGLYVMIASVVAGEWGAITMVYQAEAGYENGLSAILLGVCAIGSVVAAMGGWFSVWVRRTRIMTIPELMEWRYGKAARAIAGLAMVIAFMIMLGTFLQGLGNMFSVFLGGDPKIMMIIMLVLALIYTVTGGMWSVVLTDLFQFLILGIIIPVCAIIAIQKVGGWDKLYTGVEAALGKTGVDGVAMYGRPTLIYQFIYFFIAISIYPTALTRVCGARSVRAGYKATAMGLSSFVPRAVFPVIVGAAGLILVPGMDDGIKAYAEVMMKIVPAGVLGLIVAGMLSAFMSTADTYYMTCASMIPQDIIGPLLPKGKTLTNKQTVLLIRMGVVLTAFSALYVGYYYHGDMIYWMVKLAELMFVCGLGTSFFFGMYWKKANHVGACCSLIGGLIGTAVTNYALALPGYMVFYWGMGLSIAGMVIGSLLTQKSCPPKPIVGVHSERRALANGSD